MQLCVVQLGLVVQLRLVLLGPSVEGDELLGLQLQLRMVEVLEARGGGRQGGRRAGQHHYVVGLLVLGSWLLGLAACLATGLAAGLVGLSLGLNLGLNLMLGLRDQVHEGSLEGVEVGLLHVLELQQENGVREWLSAGWVGANGFTR